MEQLASVTHIQGEHMARTEGREPLRHVAWWVWFIPTIILFVMLLVAVKRYRTPMEQGGMSAAPVSGVAHILA